MGLRSCAERWNVGWLAPLRRPRPQEGCRVPTTAVAEVEGLVEKAKLLRLPRKMLDADSKALQRRMNPSWPYLCPFLFHLSLQSPCTDP